MELSSELIGTFGCMIGNSALRRVWTSSSGSRRKAHLGPADLLYVLDGGARAIVREDERGREPDRTERVQARRAVVRGEGDHPKQWESRRRKA